MRRIVKDPHSLILSENLLYTANGDNTRIRDLLLLEQNRFCAYTDTYFGVSDNPHIDHFNPTLKNTNEDNYYNWFLVKAQWNLNKPKKWIYEDIILHPTNDDFEIRIVYSEGDYIVADLTDIPARNTIELLDLDNPTLADERKNYLSFIQEMCDLTHLTPLEYFELLVARDRNSLRFSRAIREHFNVDIIQLLK